MTDVPISMPAFLKARQRAKWAHAWGRTDCVLAAAARVMPAGFQTRSLIRIRVESQMRLNTDALKEVPPDIALLNTLLGPLWGVWLASLWIQADTLKEENRFYDALQPAQWICGLQPRFPAVWSFNAWNKAYNNSVTKHTPEEHWKWVSSGAHLFAQQGIPLNSRTLKLYKEPAWIYSQKIGARWTTCTGPTSRRRGNPFPHLATAGASRSPRSGLAPYNSAPAAGLHRYSGNMAPRAPCHPATAARSSASRTSARPGPT